MGEACGLSIGLIADVQYADLDDGGCEGRVQRFREVPEKLRAALAALAARGGAAPPPALVLHLGDIINGNTTQAATDADFELVASIFDAAEAAGGPETLHVLGNHCLDAGRAAVCARLRIPSPGYYARLLPGGDWELLVLDTTEMSGHSGLPADAPQAAEATAFLAAHPLSEAEPQMQPWNGGVASAQLAWLEERLAAAEAAGRRVVVAGHHQVGAGAARPTHMAWNWEEVSAALLASPAFRLYLAGHDHVGGYAAAPRAAAAGGTAHFVTLQALLEAPAGGTASAALRLGEGGALVLAGRGTVPSRRLEGEVGAV